MNRIESMLQPPPVIAPVAAADVESALYRRDQDQRVALFVPLHYEANYAYPLLVWLHGEGDDESQLKRIMPGISMRNHAGVAPCGTVVDGPSSRPGAGSSWCQSPQHIALAEQRIFDAVDAARRKINVADDRIFLAGFGAGGTMAYRVGLNHSERFAGVLALESPFPTNHAPLSNLAEARNVPLFVACGRSSRVYTPEQVCGDLRLFHTAGLSLALRVYPGGHELSSEMLADMDRWMMELITADSQA